MKIERAEHPEFGPAWRATIERDGIEPCVCWCFTPDNEAGKLAALQMVEKAAEDRTPKLTPSEEAAILSVRKCTRYRLRNTGKRFKPTRAMRPRL